MSPSQPAAEPHHRAFATSPQAERRLHRRPRLGWDACTGLRVPNGQQLLDKLRSG